jgi:hypothetical protein
VLTKREVSSIPGSIWTSLNKETSTLNAVYVLGNFSFLEKNKTEVLLKSVKPAKFYRRFFFSSYLSAKSMQG